MQTHGYERSRPWRLALDLLDQVKTLTGTFEDDPFGLAGRLRSVAADLPVHAAFCFEQLDYHQAKRHAEASAEHAFRLLLHARVAGHLGLLTPRQTDDLRKRIDALDAALNELPDELFEDDGQSDLASAA